MRKLLTTLALTVCASTAALGQTTENDKAYSVESTNTARESIETGIYAIKVKSDKASNGDGRWFYATSSGITSGSNVAETLSVDDLKGQNSYLFKVTKTTVSQDSITYSIQSISTGKYWGCSDGTASAANKWTYGTTETQWTLEACTASGYTDYICVKCGKHYGCHNSGGSLGTWPISATAANMASLKFYKATELPTITATCNITDGNGATLYTATVPKWDGADMTTLPTAATPSQYSHYYTINTTCTSDVKTVSSENTTFTYTATWSESAPVKLSTNSDAGNTWYAIKLRNNDKNYVVRSDDSNIKSGYYQNPDSPFSTDNITTKEGFDNGLWAFVRSGLGVKLLNKQSNKYVTVAATDAAKASLTDESSATVFYTASTTQGTGYFALVISGNAILGDHANHYLGVWKHSNAKNDTGSAFLVQSADEDAILSIGKTAATNEFSTMKRGYDTDGYWYGGYSDEGIENKKAALSSATTVAALDEAWNSEPDARLDADAWHRIESKDNSMASYIISAATVLTDTNGDVTSESDGDRYITRVGSSDALVPALWKFEANGSGYKLVNANTGLAAGQLQSGTQDGLCMPTTSTQDYTGTYTVLSNGTAGVFNIKESGHFLNAYGGTSGAKLGSWDSDGTTSNHNSWKIKKVTEIPVEINATAGWASVCLPFAVTLPTDETIKAYKGTQAADGKLKLEEITGTVPAKTGFLLAKDGGGTATLTIATAEATGLDSNVLCGATAKRTGFDGGANYFLALDSDNKAIFMQSGDSYTQVPCNKAYLPATSIQTTTGGTSTNMLSFELDGGATTGISSAVQSQSDRAEKYYDLSGRRVLFPSNGIFVTADGKKVLVK